MVDKLDCAIKKTVSIGTDRIQFYWIPSMFIMDTLIPTILLLQTSPPWMIACQYLHQSVVTTHSFVTVESREPELVSGNQRIITVGQRTV